MNSKPSTRFRPATGADISRLRELAHKIWWECYPGIITPEQIRFMLEWMYGEREIGRQIGEGIAWEVIETAEGSAIGFLSYHAEPDGRVKLEKLYVLPAMQGMGIGGRALAHVLERAKELGATSLWMQVNKQNKKAIAAYLKAGFQIAKEAVFEIGGGYVMDDYLMERAL